MGMFDYLIVEMDLPHLPDWAENQEFQTKAFHNILDIYLIDKDGWLYRMGLNDYRTFVNYGGIIFFYQYGINDRLVEYCAILRNGIVSNVYLAYLDKGD